MRRVLGGLIRAGGLAAPEVMEALRLSLVTTALATLLVLLLGIPLAFFLVTRGFRGRRLVETLVDLPMVLPPTVAGAGLLLLDMWLSHHRHKETHVSQTD